MSSEWGRYDRYLEYPARRALTSIISFERKYLFVGAEEERRDNSKGMVYLLEINRSTVTIYVNLSPLAHPFPSSSFRVNSSSKLAIQSNCSHVLQSFFSIFTN